MLLKNGAGMVLGMIGLFLSANLLAEDTLNYCSEAAPEGFDPALYTLGATFDASSHQIYNKLLESEIGGTTPISALAESYTISNDGLEYLFRLRPNVQFHSTEYFTPSRPLNANDVVFSFERQRLADNPYHQVSGGSWELFNGKSMPELIESVEAIDELTVKFTLTSPGSPMLANLAMDFASIVSEEYAASLLVNGTPEMLTQRPIGTGPFKFSAYVENTEIKYLAHEGYWAGKAPIDELVFKITPDPSMRYKKLKAGDCHIMSYPSDVELELMAGDESISLLDRAGLDIAYLAYNTTVTPFDSATVRKALNMAIDKKSILEKVYKGKGRIAKNPIPPAMWSYNQFVPDDEYDPVRAKQMLLDEGVAALKMEVWAMPVQSPSNPDSLLMAELIKEYFSEIDVEVDVVSHEWGEFLKLSKKLDRSGAVLLNWTGDSGDPDNFMSVLLGCAAVGGANRAQWCHKPFDELITRARISTDHAERSALYKEAQQIFKEQAPWATIAHSLDYEPTRQEVLNYQVDPFGGHKFYGVSLAK